MIKNIVFDMGKVLLEYDPDRVLSHFIQKEEDKKEINSAVFASQEWVFLDMGVMPEEMALEKMQSHLDTEEKRRLAADCFWHWHEYNMYPKAGMEELIQSLKKDGFGIYLCSNASVRLLSCYRELIPAIECFDGVLFSAQVKCMKPQKEMYRHLFDRFSLEPGQCFFIDDLPLNIEGARACGMDGYCFDGDVEKLKTYLNDLLKK